MGSRLEREESSLRKDRSKDIDWVRVQTNNKETEVRSNNRSPGGKMGF